MSYQNRSFKQFFAKSFLVLAGGTFSAQIIQILIYPFVTRLFTPEDFGLKAIFTTVLVLVTSFSTGKYEEAVSIPKKDEDAVDIIVLSIFLSILAASLFFILFFFLRNFPFQHQTKYDVLIYVILIPSGIILIGIVNALVQWSMRQGEYKIMSKVKIIQSSTKGMLELSGGYFGFGGIILIFGTLVGMCGGVVTYTIFFLKQLNVSNIKLSYSFSKVRLIAAAKRYIHFPKFSVAAGLFNRLNIHLPILYFSQFSTSAILGHYSIAVLSVSIPSAIFIESILKVFYTEFALRLKSNLKKAKSLLVNTILVSTLVSAIIAFGFYFLGKPFILIAFGDQWDFAGEFLKYYGWIIIATNWFFISFYVFSLLEKQKWILIFNSIKLLLTILGFFLVFKMDFDPINAIIIYVFITLIFSAIQLLVAFLIIDKKSKTFN